ncbi:MAG: NAD(P)-binding domain-containing protein [Gemmatimonadetes bacterium]|nr:NAD(P)-binding domain-containing protein [Gemmatimonadota bacterium]
MLTTTLGFFALTALMVWLHLRSRGTPSAPTVTAVVRGTPCPRCKALVPKGSTFCPGCGVPQQIFELTQAPTSAPGAAAGGVPRAMVRADMCVGCGTCVDACPEPGAITLRGKLAVVDDALCKGHGECVRGCPVGAISVTTGTAVNRVQVPLTNSEFETNVPGLYIVGELGGRGLIKNAINEGKMAIEAVVKALEPGAERPDGDADVVDVAIVGSGPAGLSAGLEALRRGLSYVVIEQGSLSDTVRKYPRHKLLLAEPVSIPLYGDLWIADASKETLLQVWETIVANTGLQVRTGERVEQVIRADGVFRLQTSAGVHRARRVVLAMGRRGTPRRLGVPGEELDKVFYDIVEMEAFAGRRVLVVGGGDSAIESVLGLANQKDTEVTLSYRGETFSRVKDRNRAKIATLLESGRVRAIFGSVVREIRHDVAVLQLGDETTIVPNDDVVVRIGGDAPYAFLERIGVRIVEKDVPMPPQAATG